MINALMWIWLQQCIGYANRYAAAVMELPGGVRFIYDCSPEDLKALGVFPQRIVERLADKDMTKAENIYKECIRNNYDVITLDSSNYPQRLKSIIDPPAVLYVSGKIPCIDKLVSIGIVGTRSASRRGLAAAQELGRRLADAGAVIISGCAMGIDMAAQQGALMTKEGLTVGVLGCGLDSDYNQTAKELRKLIPLHGALVSEYPPGTDARRENFPQRNRIISGLSLGVAVIEAGSKSGSAITARLAVEQGRELYALPGPAGMENAEGVNGMIACGAKPFFSPADILIEYESEYGGKLRFEGTKYPLLGQPGDGELSAERVLRRGIERNRAKKNAAIQPKNDVPTLFEMAEREERTAEEKVKTQAEKQSQNEKAAAPFGTGYSLPGDISPEARAVYDAMSTAPEQIDELAQRLGKSVPEISMLILELEMNDAVISHPGKRYAKRETK